MEWQGTYFGNQSIHLSAMEQQWAVDVVLTCLDFHQIINDMLYHLWTTQVNIFV